MAAAARTTLPARTIAAAAVGVRRRPAGDLMIARIPAAIVLIIAFAGFAERIGEAAELLVHVISERATPLLAREAGGVVQLGPAGIVYFLSVESKTVHTIAPNGSTVTLTLSPTPEGASASLMEDMAIDSAGRLFIPAIWRYAPKGGSAGIFVFDSRGYYERTIELAPRTNVRHIAMDEAGNIFVLGIDPAYYRRTADTCFLVHEYSPQGERLKAFSSCPADLARTRQTSGPAWQELNLEIDRGRLWFSGGRLYQLLPASHQIRIFDPASGRPVGQVGLQSPVSASEGSPGPIVWRIVQVAEGQYLAQWSVPKGAANGAGVARSLGLVLHDKSGSSLSNPAHLTGEAMVPLFANGDGTITFAVGRPNGTIRLARSAVSLQ
jgi:hypothetical protein